MSNENSQRVTVFFIFFSLVVWIFAFRGYLTSRFELTSDALSYYDHTKFFIENLGRGVFPLWDPYWCNGAPNDFFLRRIGAVNPFYLIILLFRSIGVPYTLSYLWFLAAYYFSGMIAFYLLAMRIYNDRFIAYAGFLLLLFSALGTRIFDSYMMLITVPLIWFFYFLVAFTQSPKKHLFLGMALSFMILASTYIPFYFLLILGLFLLLFLLVYTGQIPGVLAAYLGFFKKNKILVLLSLMVLVLSFFPLISFYHHSTQGQVVLPLRHAGAGSGSTLTVGHQTLDWGAVEDFVYSGYFSDLRMFKFAVVYVPFFSIIVFVLGLFGRINRRAVLMFLLGLVLLCSIVPHGLPFYDLLYRHIFILKYFRNLHFFIWFFLIPLFVLLVLEHWHMFTEMISRNARHQRALLGYVFGVHLIAILFVWWRQDAVFSTYLMIFLSLALWSLVVLKRLRPNAWGFVLLTLTILVQPLEAYHYFSLKALIHKTPYNYDAFNTSMVLKNNDATALENTPADKETLYYASGAYNFIYQNISNYALAKYLRNKFILVDHLHPVDREHLDVPALESQFLNDDNSALVFNNRGGAIKLNGNDPDPNPKAQRIEGVSEGFKLLAFDANHLRVALDLPYEKFLIYNDSYDPYWRVSVDHIQAPLYEVNGAFKGVWVPAGKSEVEFNYGSWQQYAMNIFLSAAAFIFLMGIIYYVRLP